MPLNNKMGMPEGYVQNINPIRAREETYINFNCITDRTQEDVDRLIYLRNVILNGTNTQEEWEEYQYNSKGALNYADLERIEGNIQILGELLEVQLVSMVRGDIPRIPYFKNVLQNVKIIRDSVYHFPSTPKVPQMPLNTFQKINDIEQILLDAYLVYTANKSSKYYAGVEVYMPSNIIM